MSSRNWEQARRILRLGRPQAGRRVGPTGPLDVGPDALASLRAASVCVASGKGGTGKSVVTASLATLLARRGPTLIVDADLGVGNAHILQDASPECSFVDVVEGRRQVEDVVVSCGRQLDLLGAGSGYARMAGLTPYEIHVIASGLEKLELRYRFSCVDSAAGISNQTVAFAAACDLVLIVTTPDVTAMTDAYAFMKVLLRRKPQARVLLAVNRVSDEGEGLSVATRLSEVSRKFLGREPRWVGSLPEDRAAFTCVQHRRPVVVGAPDSELAGALVRLCGAVIEELGRHHPRGLGRELLRRCGYSPALG